MLKEITSPSERFRSNLRYLREQERTGIGGFLDRYVPGYQSNRENLEKARKQSFGQNVKNFATQDVPKALSAAGGPLAAAFKGIRRLENLTGNKAPGQLPKPSGGTPPALPKPSAAETPGVPAVLQGGRGRNVTQGGPPKPPAAQTSGTPAILQSKPNLNSRPFGVGMAASAGGAANLGTNLGANISQATQKLAPTSPTTSSPPPAASSSIVTPSSSSPTSTRSRTPSISKPSPAPAAKQSMSMSSGDITRASLDIGGTASGRYGGQAMKSFGFREQTERSMLRINEIMSKQ